MRTAMNRWVMPLVAAVAIIAPLRAAAHCDALDGPVVKAGEAALQRGTVDLALIWVKPEAEAELRAAFRQTLAVRALSPEARALADRFFLETLVRLHRAGEGAPYEGLKPAGLPQNRPMTMADQALRDGTVEALAKRLSTELQGRLLASLADVKAKRSYRPADLAAGRAYVKAYADFVHLVAAAHALLEGDHGEVEHAPASPPPHDHGRLAP